MLSDYTFLLDELDVFTAVTQFERFLVGFVFLGAAVAKFLNPKQFVETVLAFKVVPQSLGRVYATALPFVELVCAAFLLIGFCVIQVAWVLVFLLLSFVGAIAVNLIRGRHDLNCGCFGGLSKLSWPLFLRTFTLFLMTIALADPHRSSVWTIGAGISILLALTLRGFAGRFRLIHSDKNQNSQSTI